MLEVGLEEMVDSTRKNAKERRALCSKMSIGHCLGAQLSLKFTICEFWLLVTCSRKSWWLWIVSLPHFLDGGRDAGNECAGPAAPAHCLSAQHEILHSCQISRNSPFFQPQVLKLRSSQGPLRSSSSSANLTMSTNRNTTGIWTLFFQWLLLWVETQVYNRRWNSRSVGCWESSNTVLYLGTIGSL